MKNYRHFLNEEIKTKEVESGHFPNEGPDKDPEFFTKGKKDGDFSDDIIETKRFSIPAKALKPSQDAIYLSKALDMAINNMVGGDLNAMVSRDNYILDGHHRWAATMFGNPNAKVQGMQSNLTIGDLIPVLRKAGDAMGNERGTEPKGGDTNILNATIEDVEDAVYNGKNMNKKFYNKDASIAWYENLGKKEVEKRLKLIQAKNLPKGAPARKDMPKIEPEQVAKIASDLNGGKIDVMKPYSDVLETVSVLNTNADRRAAYNDMSGEERKELDSYCKKNYGTNFLDSKWDEQSAARSSIWTEKNDPDEVEKQNEKDKKF